MIHPLLIGLVTGLRSMSPLAIVSEAARRDLLPPNGAPRIIGTPLVAGGTVALALGELAGDKWDKAPDRIVPAGLLARIIPGGVAAAALAPASRRREAVALGVAGAVIVGYLGFGARMRALRRYGQTPSGLVEDVIAIGGALLIVGDATRRRRGFAPD